KDLVHAAYLGFRPGGATAAASQLGGEAAHAFSPVRPEKSDLPPRRRPAGQHCPALLGPSQQQGGAAELAARRAARPAALPETGGSPRAADDVDLRFFPAWIQAAGGADGEYQRPQGPGGGGPLV